ncbi:MAG: GTPase HflX [Nitrososphaerota archaeon]|nr:GTPase HflX [Nitrososphaerota archaeon]MDG6981839.1 GTPase HflX [Nitrososphaerota archaeon]
MSEYGTRAVVVTYPDEFAKREIAELAKAGGYEVSEVITQKDIIRSEYGVGSGKAQELEGLVADTKSDTIIIDESVTSAQANNLSRVTHVRVVDRERLILNIFAKRAVTTEAKLQVQLAELRYELPRARDSVKNSFRGEQAGFSGMGEYAVDVKFRALKRQMGFIKAKLEKSKTARELHTSERRKLGVPFVSLAGYTSSGKTTLFNRLATESKDISPDLFTTLSTTTRMVAFPNSRRKVLLSDTVGFISRLPTYLVESFRSTLDELRFADLVLLMIDASESAESIEIKLRSCRETLNELEVDPAKTLVVLNKVDLLDIKTRSKMELDPLFKDYSIVKASAVRGDGLHQLRTKILERTDPRKLARATRLPAPR